MLLNRGDRKQEAAPFCPVALPGLRWTRSTQISPPCKQGRGSVTEEGEGQEAESEGVSVHLVEGCSNLLPWRREGYHKQGFKRVQNKDLSTVLPHDITINN